MTFFLGPPAHPHTHTHTQTHVHTKNIFRAHVIQVTVNNKVVSQHPVNSDWSHRGVSFRAPSSGKVPVTFDGIDASLAKNGQGSVFLDDVHVLKISEQVFKDLNKGCNLLKYPGLNTGW